MPSEAELVAQFGVSRMTVTRALRELQAEGLVTRVQGLGTYAAHLLQVASTLTIRDLHEEITARGHLHHAEVHLSRAKRPAAPPLATQLGLARGAAGVPHADRALRKRCGAAV
jgi:GntR family histidine utilization transcriptional repressor